MSKLCSARTHSGAPCKRKILDHETVCRFHGGAAPQVRAKAEGRRALSELLSRDLEPRERRDVWSILIDAVQRLDQLMVSGDFADAPQQYVELVEKVIRAGKAVIDSGVAERMAAQKERDLRADAQRMLDLILAATDSVVDRVADQYGIDDAQREALRRHAMSTMWARMPGRPASNPALELP